MHSQSLLTKAETSEFQLLTSSVKDPAGEEHGPSGNHWAQNKQCTSVAASKVCTEPRPTQEKIRDEFKEFWILGTGLLYSMYCKAQRMFLTNPW